MPVKDLYTLKDNVFVDQSTLIGGAVKQQSYITPKSGDILEQTGKTIGTLRQEVRNTKLQGSHLNARWVVGKALVEGLEVYYNEDFSKRTTENIGGESVVTRNKEVARQVVAICEGPIEGIETIFVDGKPVDLLQTIGQYGDFRSTSLDNLNGSVSNRIYSLSKHPVTGEVHAAMAGDFQGNIKSCLLYTSPSPRDS